MHFFWGTLFIHQHIVFIKGDTNFNLAKNLLNAMDRRAPSLFTSPLLLCSVYLDPRIMCTLSDDQKLTAAMDLIKIYDRIMETNSTTSDVNHINDTLDEIQQEYQKQQHPSQNSSNRLVAECAEYEIEKPCHIKDPVMKFWVDNEKKYEVLRSLADIIHAIPSNQCCTERAFSSLSYIRNKYRMSLSPQNLSNVLMIRLNKDVYYSLRKERIRKILGS